MWRRSNGAPLPRFDARAARWCYRLLGCAMLYAVATDIAFDVWSLHTGRLFPHRHYFESVPLYGTGGLVVEWLLVGSAGACLAAGVVRNYAVYVGCIGLVASLSQRYANNRLLLLTVLAWLALAPPDPDQPDFELREHPNLELLRYQLMLVYALSAVNKLKHHFESGASLAAIATNVRPLSARPLLPQSIIDWALTGTSGKVLSVTTLLLELGIPVALLLRPRVGLVLLAVLHAGFALVIPGIWGFGLTMFAMGLLFLPPRAQALEPGGR